MEFDMLARSCSNCNKKGSCKDQKRFEKLTRGRCSRHYTSRRAVDAEILRLRIEIARLRGEG